MLYKNLPSEDLSSVMRIRAVLDYVAALNFALKLQFPNALAVLRARREYRRLRSSFTAAREENLKKNFPFRDTGMDKKQYLGAVLFTWKEIFLAIIAFSFLPIVYYLNGIGL